MLPWMKKPGSDERESSHHSTPKIVQPRGARDARRDDEDPESSASGRHLSELTGDFATPRGSGASRFLVAPDGTEGGPRRGDDPRDSWEDSEAHILSADVASVPCNFLLARLSVRMGNFVSAPQTTWIAEVFHTYIKSAKVGAEYYGTLPFDIDKLPPADTGFINIQKRTITYADKRGAIATIRGIFPVVPWQNCIFVAAGEHDNSTRRFVLSMRLEKSVPKFRPRRPGDKPEKKGKFAKIFATTASDGD